MLYWIWFAFFVSIGATLSYMDGVSDGNDQPESNTGIRGFLAIVFLFAASIMSWPLFGLTMYEWLDSSLPQANTGIHTLSVWFSMAVTYISFIVGVATLSGLLGIKRGEMKKKSQTISEF